MDFLDEKGSIDIIKCFRLNCTFSSYYPLLLLFSICVGDEKNKGINGLVRQFFCSHNMLKEPLFTAPSIKSTLCVHILGFITFYLCYTLFIIRKK